jgi:hypothetical protein
LKVLIDIYERDLAILSEIGTSGKASSGYSQTTEFCIQKAIEEFIKKYTGKNHYEIEIDIKKKTKKKG